MTDHYERNLSPFEVSVVGMPEFDALIDHIYEEGTNSEGVIPLANKLVRAAIQSHIGIRELLAERDALAAENERMQEALEAIIARSYNDPLGTSKVIDMRRIAEDAARRALGGKNDE